MLPPQALAVAGCCCAGAGGGCARRIRISLSRRVRDVLLDAGGDRPQIRARPVRQSHNARNQDNQNIVFLSGPLLLSAIKYFISGICASPGQPFTVLLSIRSKESAEDVDFAFAQADVVFNLVVAR